MVVVKMVKEFACLEASITHPHKVVDPTLMLNLLNAGILRQAFHDS